jgi:hypothetical protein
MTGNDTNAKGTTMADEARKVVEMVSKKCAAISSPYLTAEVKSAILFRAVMSPIVLSTNDQKWLLALSAAVDEFAAT